MIKEADKHENGTNSTKIHNTDLRETVNTAHETIGHDTIV